MPQSRPEKRFGGPFMSIVRAVPGEAAVGIIFAVKVEAVGLFVGRRVQEAIFFWYLYRVFSLVIFPLPREKTRKGFFRTVSQ